MLRGLFARYSRAISLYFCRVFFSAVAVHRVFYAERQRTSSQCIAIATMYSAVSSVVVVVIVVVVSAD